MSKEIGYAAAEGGLFGWSTLLEQEEDNPELRWPRSVSVYDKMRREDAQVGSVLRAVSLPIRRTEWGIDPTGCSPEVVQHVATDLGIPVRGETSRPPARARGRFSWDEHLRLVLLKLVFGHAFFEQVYTIEDSGLTRLRKLAYRPPRTISGVDVARDGGLEAIWQHGVKKPIPVTALVAHVNEREGGNWFGQSLLRQAYKNWLLKDRALRVQSMTLERNGLGIPVYEGAPVPDGATATETEHWVKSEREGGLKLATGLRAGQTSGASIPHGGKLTLQGVVGDLPDADKPIRYYDEQIARAVLAHFLNLGTETGSWALGSTFADFFVQSLQAVAMDIASTTQQHVIEDLVDLNWGEDEPAPRLVFDAIGSKSQLTADALKALIDSGAIWPDRALEEHLRSRYGLPAQDRDDDGSRESLRAAYLEYLMFQRMPEEGR